MNSVLRPAYGQLFGSISIVEKVNPAQLHAQGHMALRVKILDVFKKFL